MTKNGKNDAHDSCAVTSALVSALTHACPVNSPRVVGACLVSTKKRLSLVCRSTAHAWWAPA
eukprot:356347-Chlamydomonas_euryale.AAC.2